MKWIGAIIGASITLYLMFGILQIIASGAIDGKFNRRVTLANDPGLFWFDIAFYVVGVVACLFVTLMFVRAAFGASKKNE